MVTQAQGKAEVVEWFQGRRKSHQRRARSEKGQPRQAVKRPHRQRRGRLTRLQLAFCEAYARNPGSAADALKVAGSRSSGSALAVAASKLLRLGKVREEVERLMAEYGTRIGPMEPSKPLDNTQYELFVQMMLSHPGWSHERCASEAGYSAASARTQASRMLKNVEVWARLEFLKRELASESISTAHQRRELLTRIERGELSAYFDEHGRIDVQKVRLAGPELQELHVIQVNIGTASKPKPAEIIKIKMRDPRAAAAEHNRMDGTLPPEEHDIHVTGDGHGADGSAPWTVFPKAPVSVEDWSAVYKAMLDNGVIMGARRAEPARTSGRGSKQHDRDT